MTEEYKTDEVFWGLLRKGEIMHEAATIILTSRTDITEAMHDRAQSYIDESISLTTEAWTHFSKINDGVDFNFMRFDADRINKTVKRSKV